ncbi:MAG: GTP-binding protein, partial [Bacteroidales bacterium]
MKTYTTEQIRNVVLMGNTKSGKTTLAEAMMMEGKVIDRRGTVEAKNTVCDNTEIEQLYQRSIYPTLFYTEYEDHKLNFIDTPGSDDFIGGLISAFRVADSGVMLVNGQHGVEVGTEIFSRYAEQQHKPLFLAVSQLDHEKANWDACMDSLHEAYGNKVCPVQFPVDAGAGFNSFVDVVKMK